MPGALLTPPITPYSIAVNDPVNPTIANLPHANINTNVTMLYNYLYNDGSGSGINADDLDGHAGSYYLDLTNAVNALLPANFTDTSHGNRAGGALHPVATESVSGFLSSADKTKLDGIAAGSNNYVLPAATASVLGGVIVGSGLSVDGSGHLTANISLATTGVPGIMQVGSYLLVTSGVVSVDTSDIALLDASNTFSQIQNAPAFNTPSARELKSNIKDATLSKYDFSKIRIREWDWKSNGQHAVGVIADELVDAGFSDFVGFDATGKPISVNYPGLSFALLTHLAIKKSA